MQTILGFFVSILNVLTPVERGLASGNCGLCAKTDRRWVVRKLVSARAILRQALYPGLYQKCSLFVRMGGTNLNKPYIFVKLRLLSAQ